MGRNIYSRLQYPGGLDYFTIAGGASATVDIDLSDVNQAQCLIELRYAATGATTGCSVNVYYGMGPSDSTATGSIPCKLNSTPTNVVFSDNSDSVTMATVTANQATAQVKRTYLIFNDPLLRNTSWQRLAITNNDASNAVTVRLHFET